MAVCGGHDRGRRKDISWRDGGLHIWLCKQLTSGGLHIDMLCWCRLCFGRDIRSKQALVLHSQLFALAACTLGLLASALPFALRAPRDPNDRALAAFMALPLATVLVSSFVRVPEPNWTAPAWPAVLVYLSLGAPRVSARVWKACVALTTVVAVLLHAQAITGFLPIPPEKDQSARMLRGWKRWVCHEGPLPASDLPAYAAASEREIYQNRCGE